MDATHSQAPDAVTAQDFFGDREQDLRDLRVRANEHFKRSRELKDQDPSEAEEQFRMGVLLVQAVLFISQNNK